MPAQQQALSVSGNYKYSTLKTITGIYFKKNEDYSKILRFYDDNSVVGISSSAHVSKVFINKGKINSGNGTYKMDENGRISFSLKSSIGIVNYEGKVLNSEQIQLQSTSLINGYSSEGIFQLFKPEVTPFEKIGNHRNRRTSYWTCNICDGDSETGCLYFDSTECPRRS